MPRRAFVYRRIAIARFKGQSDYSNNSRTFLASNLERSRVNETQKFHADYALSRRDCDNNDCNRYYLVSAGLCGTNHHSKMVSPRAIRFMVSYCVVPIASSLSKPLQGGYSALFKNQAPKHLLNRRLDHYFA